MIASIRGTLTTVGADYVVVETGGIGYHVVVPNSVLPALGVSGSEVFLYTYLHVREDALILYGFDSPSQRSFFETLISVSGVGPKLALGLLSAASLDQLQQAIASENIALLAQVPGVGKKTAARIVLELKGKLDLSKIIPGVTAATPATATLNAELLDVLTSLGYNTLEAQSAIAALPPDAPSDLEGRLRLVLRYFGGV